MADQAEMLRQRLSAETKQAKVWGIVSGKGGVGKSNISANLAISLSKSGYKVLVFDLDIGMGNIDLLLGKASSKNILDMLQHGLGIWDIIEQDRTGISHIAGGRNFSSIASLDSSMMDHFFMQLSEAETVYDHIILDMGAGITEWSLGFILCCDEVLTVTTPEITSITDAYSMIKHIHASKPELSVALIINRFETIAEGKAAAAKLTEVSHRFLNKRLKVLGMIPYDMAVKNSVKNQVPFVLSSPSSPASRSVKEMAAKLAGEPVIQQRSSFFTRLRAFLIER
ncbi:MinD/ParA family protein [Fictibacillus iocasae]|uniref:MinD/ParA family protein n=1 Tax=Fictibacillus iocasae TaxID=2715437 RepID=A0ABW2NNH9_9BACL